MTFAELEAEVKRLGMLIESKSDEDIKYRRSYEDLMYNLSFENMPTVEVEAQKTASVISEITKNVESVGENVSKIEQTVDEQGAKIALVVYKSDGNDVIDAASIITAINEAGSSIKLSADKISFDGSDITFDTKMLKVNANNGCVSFSSPVSVPVIYATGGVFQGRVDLGSAEGFTGYVYLNCGESNQMEIAGDGGIILTTNSESGDASGTVEVYADALNLNGNTVLTRSEEDINYLKTKLGL